VDGGYISWVYGSRPNFGSWDVAKEAYSYDAGAVILMDSPELWRTYFYEDYKGKRARGRKEDPQKQARHRIVQLFRRIILQDPRLHTVIVRGCEADDLLAVSWILGHGRDKVIAIDKDLRQVPGLGKALRDSSGEPLSGSWGGSKFPKYVNPPRSSGEFLLYQALFGDKSDSVPRILPLYSEGKMLFGWFMSMPTLLKRYWAAYTYFGYPLIRNLKLLVVPAEFLRKDLEDSIEQGSDPSVFLDLLASGEYWEPEGFQHLEFLLER